MSSWRRQLRRDERGLSEIVGTLMLIIIVVTAATLLAAFVATYQKQVQTEEAYSHDQSLESIHILGLETELNANGTAFSVFGFTIASESVNPSTVLGISINNLPLENFTWTNPATGASGYMNISHDVSGNSSVLSLTSFDQVSVSTDLCVVGQGLACSFFNTASIPSPNQYVKFDVYTTLQNDFSKVYLPPAALSAVSEINPSGNNPITLLDGSTSFQPGGNATIDNWAWTVAGGSFPSNSTSTSLLSATFTDNGVTTPNGALFTGKVVGTGATATFTMPTGFKWNGQYSAAFVSATNLTVMPSTCALSGSSIIPGASGTYSGNTLTLTFSFTTVISAGCTAATLSLSLTGVVPIFTATGEEYQISPALPGTGPYTVVLVVTSSDGLVGSSNSTYYPPA